MFYTKVNTDYSITFPKQLRAKLNEMNNECIYILRNNYISLYYAVYSQPLAEALKKNSLEVSKLYVENNIVLNIAAVQALQLSKNDTVRITLNGDTVFIDKYAEDR